MYRTLAERKAVMTAHSEVYDLTAGRDGEAVLAKSPACFVCRQQTVLRLLKDDLAKYQRGAHPQDAFPYLDANGREMVFTGIHASCWDSMFAGKSEDGDNA